MDNTNDVIELLDILYGMVTEAWGVPLGNDKCIIEREKAIEIINDIKANLPTSLAEAKRLVAARDEFIGNAKREAEALRKSAEEKARIMVEEQEIVRIAQERSAEMIASAEAKSKELRRVATEYVDDLMRQTEQSMSEALATIRGAHESFQALGGTAAPAPAQSAPQPQQPRQQGSRQAAPQQRQQNQLAAYAQDDGFGFLENFNEGMRLDAKCHAVHHEGEDHVDGVHAAGIHRHIDAVDGGFDSGFHGKGFRKRLLRDKTIEDPALLCLGSVGGGGKTGTLGSVDGEGVKRCICGGAGCPYGRTVREEVSYCCYQLILIASLYKDVKQRLPRLRRGSLFFCNAP